jgi:hypothetical protein
MNHEHGWGFIVPIAQSFERALPNKAFPKVMSRYSTSAMNAGFTQVARGFFTC